jgi:phage tail sheath protein FI/uncharacterized protein YjdB
MAAAFTYPGVYIEELSSGLHTITGVATSIAAFIGWASQGPVTEATLVQSWSDYQTLFGGLDARSKLGYAVNQFFANGGQQCYIVRLVWDGSLTPSAGSPAPCSTALATGIGSAAAQIVATVGSISASGTLNVGPKVLESIAITPASLPPIPIGALLQLSASGSFSDGSSATPPGVNWVSSDPTVISVTSAGIVTAMGLGTATLTVTSGLISASVTLTTTAATLVSIGVTPSAPSLPIGQTLQLAATAKYSDLTSPDVTSAVTWACNTLSVATFIGTPAIPLSPGELYGLSASAATVQATVPWTFPASMTPTPVTASPAIPLTVNAAAVTALTVVPTSPTVPLQVQGAESEPPGFSVVATYSDNKSHPSPTVTWSSSNQTVATVDQNSGALKVLAVGTTTVTATFTDSTVTPHYTVIGSTTLTVTSAHLTTLTVTPQVLSIAGGLTQQLTATGVFDDGTSADLTGSATWSSSNPTDATVIATSGLVSAGKGITSAASLTIEAQWMGLSANANLTVNPPILQTLVVSPLSTSVLSGQTQQFTATGTMSDGTAWSGTPAWTPSAPNIASVNAQGVATALAPGGSLTLFAANPGAWGNTLRVSVTVQPNSSKFNLLVQQLNTSGQLQTLESFVNLSVMPSDPQYVVTVIDNDSSYITFIDPSNNTAVVPSAAPSATPPLVPIALSGGADGAVLWPATDQNFELALTSNSAGGVYLLDRVDIFNLLCIPGETDAPTISTLQEYCDKKRAFFLVDAPQLITTASLINSGPVGSTPGSITGTYANNSAYYFPWILAPDPLFGNRPTLFPPCGFVAGIYAATDASRGVWKAPAGIDASLTGDSGLQYNLTDAENGSLNPQAINCLRQFKVYGDVVWGARTLAGNDQAGSEWKYIPIRRLARYLESSLFDGTQWVVFEPNDETLWGQVRLNVGAFMQGLFLEGAFAGTTPQQAYFVKCDGENNPPASVALGIVNILVGFAPLYPAEFVVIQIQQIGAQSS